MTRSTRIGTTSGARAIRTCSRGRRSGWGAHRRRTRAPRPGGARSPQQARRDPQSPPGEDPPVHSEDLRAGRVNLFGPVVERGDEAPAWTEKAGNLRQKPRPVEPVLDDRHRRHHVEGAVGKRGAEEVADLVSDGPGVRHIHDQWIHVDAGQVLEAQAEENLEDLGVECPQVQHARCGRIGILDEFGSLQDIPTLEDVSEWLRFRVAKGSSPERRLPLRWTAGERDPARFEPRARLLDLLSSLEDLQRHRHPFVNRVTTLGSRDPASSNPAWGVPPQATRPCMARGPRHPRCDRRW